MRLDNFKFMDSWPAWVRWLASVLLPGAAVVIFVMLAVSFPPSWSTPIVFVDIFCAAANGCSFLFVWGGAASAPRFKLIVALFLGLAALALTLDLADFDARELILVVPGVVLAWGIILWGYLRRRRAGLPSR